MLRTNIVLLATLLLATGAAAGQVYSIGEAADGLSVAVSSRSLESTVIEYELGSFSLVGVEIGANEYHAVSLGRESRMLKRGYPDLPNVCRSIAIPDDAEVAVRVVSSHFVDYEGVDVAPSKGELERSIDPATVPHVFGDVYGRDAWYPSDLVTTREPYILRDHRGTVVVLNPFQYNPARRTLRVYDRVTVEARVVGPGKVNVLAGPVRAARTPEFESIYERHFVNYDAVSATRYTPVGEVGAMLVIAYDSFMPAMEPFVDWKLQMGMPCEMVSVSTAGGTAPAIQSFIQDYYDTYGVTFVLLVGDAEQVPTLTAAGGTSDPSYSLVAGDDYYSDIIVGRFSAETVAEVETQVLRSVEYEKEPMAGAEWYHKGTGIASSQGPGDDDEYDDEHVDNIRDDLLGSTYTHVDQIYDPSASAAMVTAALNEGRSIINYTGHGSCGAWGTSGFANSNVYALTNDNMLPFIWSVACANGMFSGMTCFAEAWLRATNGSEPTGAIATLMSSINQDWDEPMDAQDEMVDLLVAGAKRTFGGLSVDGGSHMLDEYGVLGYDDFLSWHIFGDPSIWVRTDTPVPLVVEHDTYADPSSTTFDVSVTGIEGALAALYYDGDSYGAAYTDATGNATISIQGVLPSLQEVTVTVTSHNAVPYMGSFQVGEAFEAIVDVAPSSFDAVLEPGGVSTGTMTISNLGEPQSLLYYELEIAGVGMTRGAGGFDLSIEPDTCEPGDVLELEVVLTNDGTDGEWVNGASIGFPGGVTVNSCTDLTVSDRALVWNGSAGSGARVVWEGNWWNVVYPGETARATVVVTIDAYFEGNVDLIFGIDGDGHGESPHALSGTRILDCGATELLTLTSPNGNEVWGRGETRDIMWIPSGYPVRVDILHSSDGGATWVTAVAATDDDGECSWPVDAHVSDNCLMRVQMTHDSEEGDASDASFSVYEPVAWLTATPSEGSVAYGAGVPVEVTLDSSGVPDGDYFAEIVVNSNGGDPVTVPVTLSIASTGADDRISEKVEALGNYPNPFAPSTRIAFSLPETARVSMFVYTVGGRLVRTLTDEVYSEGRHSISWDGRDGSGNELPGGVYFYILESGGTELSGKMVLLH